MICVKNEHLKKDPSSIKVTEGGNMNCANEHSSKTYFPIEVKEEGFSNLMFFNDVHPPNAKFLIEVTEEGIVIWVNDEHPLKVYCSIEVEEEGIVICVNDEQPEKALSPNEITEEGIEICINDEHFLKAEISINVTDEGMAILFILMSLKSSSDISCLFNK